MVQSGDNNVLSLIMQYLLLLVQRVYLNFPPVPNVLHLQL